MVQITIVIPTLNEQERLRSTILHTVKQCADPKSIRFIVVDAGSEDSTIDSVADLDLQVIVDPSLRGRKYESLNRGLTQSSSPVTLFLDADTLLPKGFDAHVNSILEDRRVVGGAFELTFDTKDWRLGFVRLVNKLRYSLEQLYYGDQAIFCRTQAARDIGGVPPKPLMEAAYFCRSLKRLGSLRLIPKQVVTSARRFEEKGLWAVFFFDLYMWGRFTLGLDVSRYAGRYWRIPTGPKLPPAP